MDLGDDAYDRLVRMAFNAGRTPHGTIARHVISLALDDPDLMERAIALAKADVQATKAAKRRK
ncbi:MAG: hypothetical protein IVW52_18875 [Acidimicrobiales bacterium]|nr:hypothetical protein [Acidimicrobiales bacterium]